jgi:hypothetical protein
MNKPLQIPGIAGRLRRESFNRAALRAATKPEPGGLDAPDRWRHGGWLLAGPCSSRRFRSLSLVQRSASAFDSWPSATAGICRSLANLTRTARKVTLYDSSTASHSLPRNAILSRILSPPLMHSFSSSTTAREWAYSPTIGLELDELNQLFNPLDLSPYQNKDLNPEVEEFIVCSAHEHRPDEAINIAHSPAKVAFARPVRSDSAEHP